MGVGIYPPPSRDTGWIAASLLNSWVWLGTKYTAPAYRKVDDRVYLKGLVRGGVVGNSILVLPSAFRPTEFHHCLTVVSLLNEATGSQSAGTSHTHPIPFQQAATALKVTELGEVLVDAPVANTYISLDSVSFFVP